MNKYDFRFDTELFKSFIGKNFAKYKREQFILKNTSTCILGFEIYGHVYGLTNDYEGFDYLSIDDEGIVFQISEMDWNKVDSMIGEDIKEEIINEKIDKVILVNDHTTLKKGNQTEYDMWETKAIVFCFKDYELCFAKEDCWLSMEIEIHKGKDLLNKISDSKGLLSDIDFDESDSINIDRSFVEIL